jgi:hypothetical protein
MSQETWFERGRDAYEANESLLLESGRNDLEERASQCGLTVPNILLIDARDLGDEESLEQIQKRIVFERQLREKEKEIERKNNQELQGQRSEDPLHIGNSVDRVMKKYAQT